MRTSDEKSWIWSDSGSAEMCPTLMLGAKLARELGRREGGMLPTLTRCASEIEGARWRTSTPKTTPSPPRPYRSSVAVTVEADEDGRYEEDGGWTA